MKNIVDKYLKGEFGFARKLIGIAVVVVIMLSAFSLVSCNRFQSENGLIFYLKPSSKEYTVYAGNGLSAEVVIPSEFNGKPVTEIMGEGFANNAINGSFKVGKTDEIKSIFIPASIKKIWMGIFMGCVELETITVANDNPFYKSDSNCLIEIATNMVIAGCGASVIPDYITRVATYSFVGTKLWNNAPDNDIVYVGKWVVGFKGNIGKSIVLDSDTTGIGNGAFSGCSQLESIKLSSTLKSIGEYAFFDCSSLKDIIIPLSVTLIPPNVFIGCESLVTIYAEAEDKPVGWDDYWKPYYCSVVWGYKE